MERPSGRRGRPRARRLASGSKSEARGHSKGTKLQSYKCGSQPRKETHHSKVLHRNPKAMLRDKAKLPLWPRHPLLQSTQGGAPFDHRSAFPKSTCQMFPAPPSVSWQLSSRAQPEAPPIKKSVSAFSARLMPRQTAES